jgi:hypothetical protein
MVTTARATTKFAEEESPMKTMSNRIPLDRALVDELFIYQKNIRDIDG